MRCHSPLSFLFHDFFKEGPHGPSAVDDVSGWAKPVWGGSPWPAMPWPSQLHEAHESIHWTPCDGGGAEEHLSGVMREMCTSYKLPMGHE